MNSDLQGKVVLITGASGGIGSAIARQFAAEGANLILHYRTGRDRAEQLQNDLASADSVIVRANLAKENDVETLFEKAIARFGRIDTVIANAGSWETRDVPLQAMSLKQWHHTMDNVLTATFLTMREYFRIIARQKRGNAVLISSTAAVFGESGHVDYASAKAAMAYGMVRSLKNEMARLAPHTKNYCGGRINCICPGWTVVPRSQAKLGDATVVQKVTATMAIPQIGRPEDMAHAAVFLSSDTLARHLTGQTLVIAGGMEGRLLWQPGEIDPTAA